MINFSIVIPAFNEIENLKILIPEIYNCLKKENYNFELIIVDDCSTDNTYQILDTLKSKYPMILLKNKSNIGQSYSIKNGIELSKSEIIVTMDGDCQNDPSDIPTLLNLYLKKTNLKLVGGIRVNRKDSISKKIASILANHIRSLILNDRCIDTGCSLKVFDKSIFINFPFFNGMHRFLPALFTGYNHETMFIEVKHRYRHTGVSNYNNFKRFFLGIKDIIKVYKIIKRNKSNV